MGINKINIKNNGDSMNGHLSVQTHGRVSQHGRISQPYPKYKNSNIPWLVEIPDRWKIVEIRRLFTNNKEKNFGLNERNLLSLSYGNLKRKNIDTATGLVPASFEGYQIINEGYIILRFTDLQNDKNSLRVGYAYERGIITSAYIGIIPKPNINSKYYYYHLHFLDLIKHFYNGGSGVRQSLGYNEFSKEKVILPPKEEQTAIARFLDYKLAKINRFIHKKKQLIKLLNEQKAAIINQAVTKGLDPNGKMKDSGIEWLGEIPEHWEVIKNKYLNEINMGQSPSSDNYNFEGKGKPFLQGNAEFGYLNPSPKTWCENANKICSKNDILLSVRAPIGAVNIADQEYGIGRGLSSISCKSNLMFWFYQFLTLKERLNSIGTGSTYYAISIDDVKNIYLLNPPDNEKEKISNYIEQETAIINTTISSIEKEIALVEEYKMALIAEAVTGKIDVRGYEVPEVTEEETYEEIEEEISMAAEDAEAYQTVEE